MVTNWKNLGQATLCATFLSGALLVTVPANAQLADDAPIPAPSFADAKQTEPTQSRIDLEFENIQVVELLKVIAKTCKINVLINEDVSGMLTYVNISSKTPEEALQYVARNAGLKVRRESDGTYQISKSIVDNTRTTEVGAPIGIVPKTFGGGFTGSNLENNALDMFGVEPLTSTQSNRVNSRQTIDELPGLVDISKQNSQQSSKGSTTPIRVKNLKASIMAYWLDPANNPVPVDLLTSKDAESKYGTQPIARNALNLTDQTALNGNASVFGGGNQSYGGVAPSPYLNPYVQRSTSSRIAPEVRSNFQFGGFGNNQGNQNQGNRNQTGGGQNNQGGGTFELPGEIEQIIAVDAQNVLLVAGGTPDDIIKLKEIIAVLDRPLRQVEIEAQFVEITESESKNFGIDYSTSRGNFDFSTNPGFNLGGGSGGIQLGFVRGNFRATLQALATEGRLKIVTAPRVTAINNLTASIQSSQSTPITLTTAVAGGGVGGGTAEGQNLIYITTNIGLNVTPTINGDDTITVLMQPQLQSQTPSGDISGAPVISSNQVQTIANVKDGDTIALGGLRVKSVSKATNRIPLLSDIPVIGKLFESRRNNLNDRELIIFVTARIVRRAGDEDELVPGT